LKLQADCTGDVSVSSITVHHQGLGSSEDIKGVYLMSGVRRLSRVVTIARSTQTAVLRMQSFLVTACSQVDVDVYMDMTSSAASGGEHRFVLQGSSDIAATGRVDVQSDGSSGTVRTTPSNHGSIAVTYLNLPRRLVYGADQIVGRVMLDASGHFPQAIHFITFTNDGKARNSDLQNVWIGNNKGEHLTQTALSLSEDRVRFVFDPPFVMEQNGRAILNVHADIRASRSQTIRMLIEEPSDIEANDVVRSPRG
jgi:hypothetical protein